MSAFSSTSPFICPCPYNPVHGATRSRQVFPLQMPNQDSLPQAYSEATSQRILDCQVDNNTHHTPQSSIWGLTHFNINLNRFLNDNKLIVEELFPKNLDEGWEEAPSMGAPHRETINLS